VKTAVVKYLAMKLKTLFLLGGLSFVALIASSPEVKPDPIEAARLNNLGAAYMNQQLFEKGLKTFQDAAALDPKLEIAKLNQGIALLNLTRIDQARELLQDAVKKNPNDPHAWFNLGLLYKNSNNPQGAVDAFRHVTEIDPDDPDTWYFVGAAYSQSKQYPQAIAAFQHALKLNPLHASAEFGISRAYQQSGDSAHARENLQKFQRITQAKLGSPIGLAYGDQGKYSLVEESPAVGLKVPPQIPVKFVDVTREAGLISKVTQGPSDDLASFLGPGACFLDYDRDGKIDILLADNGAQGGISLYHNMGNSKFEDVTKKAGLDPTLHGIGCTSGDYDNDGFADIVFTSNRGVALLHNEKNGAFRDVAQATGIVSQGVDVGATFIDYDHDGDLDLYVTGLIPGTAPRASLNLFAGRAVMWRNNNDGTFTDVTESIGLSGSGFSVATIGTDYNNDRAVDLVTTGMDLRGGVIGGGLFRLPILFKNPREGRFTEETPIAVASPIGGLAVLDIDHDGWMDLVFTHSSGSVTLWRNDRGKSFGQIKLPETNWAHAYGIAAFDYDNDGWVDLVAAGETKEGRGEVRLFRNLGPDGWKDVTADVGLDKIQLKDPRAIITGDCDNDGATDLLITQNHGPAVLLRNEGGNRNNWLRLNLKGLADNKSAIGTKVEVFSDGIRQKFEIYGSNGYLGQNSPYLTVGLGQAKQADIVRMLWPSGVLQDEIEVAANKEHSFLEMDRRGSSCPTLFAWDGEKYQLVGDMLGAGVIGHWVGPGQRNIPRPTEYVKIDRNMLREKIATHLSHSRAKVGHPLTDAGDSQFSQNGGEVGHPVISLRFMEPLEEVVYLDKVDLWSVDHPAEFDVFPNEYFASNPPFPEFKVVFSRDARPPAGAWDEHGHDVLPDILAHRYFGDFELESFNGFAKPHSLELNLGRSYRGGPLWLLLHGEIEYFTATGMYAADQADIHAIAPYVEAQNTNGKWIKVVDDMGFPAGGARTMTADLTGKLPVGTQRIRITTNLQIYWDKILISRTPQNQKVRLTSVPLIRADLRFHGFPLKIEGNPPGNVKYVYEKASATGPYTRPVGAYTRYGDVRSLLTAFDDRLVVFGAGDEVALDFDSADLPLPPKGWVRDYFFAANGYEKDMDFYAAQGDTVDPLPFRSMGTYPYSKEKSFPLDDAHMNDLLEYNTRHLSGNEPRGYAFDYGSEQ
jgi:tetratricopeptide (TPR) repeat protein